MNITTISLTDSQRVQLESGFHHGLNHVFRMRCRAILLKSQGFSSAKVGEQTKMTAQTVNSWLKRYRKEAIKGLETPPDRNASPY